jgi:hypothetical protein
MQKNIPILINLFDHSVRLYTNITFSADTKDLIKSKLDNKCIVNDNLTYDQIMFEINNSHPMGSTDFLIPFEVLMCISEIDETAEIFFLSDGHNGRSLNEENLNFLTSYKNRVTTLGIGSKNNYDGALMSKMSKTNDTIEGQSSDIIQQELLAQMSDTAISIDTWTNVEINIIGKKSNLKVGSMMTLSEISEEEYNKTIYEHNTDNTNLVLDIGSNNNMMISKKDIMINSDIEIKSKILIFIVDQSGSMADPVDYTRYCSLSPSPSIDTEPDITVEDLNIINSEENTSDYVKYTMNLPKMKSYQRIIFSSENLEFKAQIKWTDVDNTIKTMILHDMKKYKPIVDPIINQSIDIANTLGNYINIATISNKDDNIGYFRKINQICKKHNKFFDDILERKILTDFSLMELLFYNKKQGLILFNSTMTKSERNMHELLGAVSSGGGYKLLAATATMSAVCNRTPSSQSGGEYEHYHNRDISMCSICFDEIREYMFSCGHCYACKSCAEKTLDSNPKNKCSYCKQDVTWIRKIKMTEDQKNNEHYYKCISDECYNIASIVAKCKPMDEEDSGHHLTYCKKCFTNAKHDYKKSKKTRSCFCGCEITAIVNNIYFN